MPQEEDRTAQAILEHLSDLEGVIDFVEAKCLPAGRVIELIEIPHADRRF